MHMPLDSHRRRRRLCGAVGVFFFAFSSPTLNAQAADLDVDEPLPDVDLVQAPSRSLPDDKQLLSNKLHPTAGRWEASLTVDISFADRFVFQRGARGSVGFHVFDELYVEGYVGYWGLCATTLLPSDCESTIAKTARGTFPSHQGGESFRVGDEPYLSDLWMSNVVAGLTAHYAPLYGKVSLASEWDVSFQAYGLAGVGVDGIWKVTGIGDPEVNEREMQWAPTYVTPSAHVGVGVRFLPFSFVALRAEVRGHAKPTPPPNAPPDEEPELFDVTTTAFVVVGVSVLL